MKRIVSVFTAIFISMICFAQRPPAVGDLVTEIKLPNVKGTLINLSALRGKVVLVDFWASWCGPCRRSMPELMSLYKKYNLKGFEIYGISLDEDKDEWKKAVLEDGGKWLHVNDANGEVAGQWNINYIPDTFLIGKDGKIILIDPTHADLNAQLQKLLH